MMLETEANERSLIFIPETFPVTSEQDKRRYHALLLCDAGLFQRESTDSFRLTSAGHDFIEAMRDEGIWKKTKDAVAQTGGNATLEIVKKIATGFLKKQIKDRTGLDV